jgi:hypothetical protein
VAEVVEHLVLVRHVLVLVVVQGDLEQVRAHQVVVVQQNLLLLY